MPPSDPPMIAARFFVDLEFVLVGLVLVIVPEDDVVELEAVFVGLEEAILCQLE